MARWLDMSRPRLARPERPNERSQQGSLIPSAVFPVGDVAHDGQRTATGAFERVRVLIALVDSSLSMRINRYLTARGDFILVEARNGQAPPVDVAVVDFTPEVGLASLHGVPARPVGLAADCDDSSLLAAMRAGAWALLSDHPSPFEVTAAVGHVAAGQCPILEQIARRPRLAAVALGQLQSAGVHPCPLSAREAAILTEVARGAKNGVIAAILGLHEQTVKNYLSEILRKTGAVNRAEAAALAVRHGWVPPD
jgi:DNA-binding NarL/FixJ family response regulator